MKKLQTLVKSVVILSALFLISCGKDDSVTPSPHIVGAWELRGYVSQNAPNTHTNVNNRIFPITALQIGNLAITKEDFSLTNDNKYTKSVRLTAGPDRKDDGTWTLTDTSLKLKSSQANATEITWKVAKNENNQLWLAESRTVTALSNSFIEKIADLRKNNADSIKKLTVDGTTTGNIKDSVVNANLDRIIIDWVYTYERAK